jgi:tRNA dimethylallyltransferase
LSLDVAETLIASDRPVEVVNADAMQLYRGMDIGTAKLPEADRRGIPHHLFDVLDVSEVSTVADYQALARAAVGDIRSRGAIPVVVGGSGLYISALVHDLRFPGTDAEVRAVLEAELEDEGTDAMWARLHSLDPEAARVIDRFNGRRVIRALEVIAITGEPYSATLPDRTSPWTPHTLAVLDVPLDERSRLKLRLAERVQGMFRDGLVEETRELLGAGLRDGVTASRAIGYAQAIGVIDGTLDEGTAVEETTALTLRYVRRQRSWFGRYADAVRITAADALARVLQTLPS